MPAVTARPWPVTPTPHPSLNPDATLHNNNHTTAVRVVCCTTSTALVCSLNLHPIRGSSSGFILVQTHYRKYKSLHSASNFPIIVMSLTSFSGNEGREDGVYQQVELSDETDGFQLCQEIETVFVHIHISCHDVSTRQ